MERDLFGQMPDGRDVHVLTIGGGPGVELSVLTLGATVHTLVAPCGDGVRRDVVLGHGSVADRLASGDYIGGTIGRYANRIAAGRFDLDGREVTVQTHDRGNSLHGGPDGFDRQVWEVLDLQPDRVRLRHVSPAGAMGFPGELTVEVTYRVQDTRVEVTLEATTDAATVVNLTNHAYFNLDGDGAGSVDDHLLQLDADEFTPVDATGIPVGGHAPVDGTPFDFRAPRAVGPAVRDAHEQVRAARGIDHNLVVRGSGLRRAAVLESTATRTRLEVWSDQPGLQVYTGNFLDGSKASSRGVAYRQGDGIALEPQLFPDSPNRPEWPSSRLDPGDRYRALIIWQLAPARPAAPGTP